MEPIHNEIVNETRFYISVAVLPTVTMLAVFIGVLINNNRLSDVNNRIGDLRGEMTAQVQRHA